jgi:hypothetical protein
LGIVAQEPVNSSIVVPEQLDGRGWLCDDQQH